MTNQVSFQRVLDSIYALSALTAMGDMKDAVTFGRDDEQALMRLVEDIFAEICASAGLKSQGEQVEYPSDIHTQLQNALLEETADEIGLIFSEGNAMTALRRALRPKPARRKGYFN